MFGLLSFLFDENFFPLGAPNVTEGIKLGIILLGGTLGWKLEFSDNNVE